MKTHSLYVGLIAATLTVNALAAKELPTETPDGLQLVPDTEMGAVYTEPGLDLSGYKELGLVPCEVSFRKNWLRDQRRKSMDLSRRATQEDVARIKDKLASLCTKHFKQALLEDPAYTLVEKFTRGEAVLIVQPYIVNLDVTAPDLRSAGRESNYTTSAGEMTLILELFDGTTGDTLVRAYDRAAAGNNLTMQWQNSVANKADAERILKMWSGRLRDGLDQAIKHGSP